MKIEDCTLCGSCLVCPYLNKYGYPKEIFLKKDPSVFICTNCGLCDRLCPFEIEPSKAIYSVKEVLIKEGSLSEDNFKAIKSARSYSKTMSRFPISHFDLKETVFFPGCALISMGNDIVFSLRKWLEAKLHEKIGLTIHCCGDPMFQNGDTDSLSIFTERLKTKLENCGVSKIIFACSNCKKVFKKYIEGFELVHISELVGKADIKVPLNNFILHHPCPNFKNDEIRNSIDNSFSSQIGKTIENPSCCGLGGSASKLDKDVANTFLNKIKELSDSRSILTSCMGCKNRFLKNGIESKHIYELITGIDIKNPVSDKEKWINRIKVALRTKVNLKKLLLFMLILIGSIFVYNLQKADVITVDKLLSFVKTSKYLAPMIYIIIYSIGPSIFFPSLILTIISGMLWGPFWGVIFAICGATIGCSIPFLLSRYILHDNVKRLFGVKRWEKLTALVEKNGWKVVAFTRIVPIFPFPVLNYLFGITPIKFFHYVTSSFLFMLPACIAYVYFGSGIFELIMKGNFSPLIFALLLISLIMIIPWVLRNSKIISKDNDESKYPHSRQ